ncbi:MAG TPA: hypothetical protein VF624_17350 [Tepidisphaeraceae bacterium]|jgi:hypothetical protein
MLKKLFAKSTVEMKPQAAAVRSAAVETLEDRRMMATQPFALGINVTTLNDSTYSKQVATLRETGTKSVRLWWGITDFNSRTNPWNSQFAKRFSDDGFDVMVAVVPKSGMNPSSYDQAYNYFKFLASGDLKNHVDRWQIGNEPDHEHYWRGTVESYVTKLLAPASAALRSVGEKVVSAGPSWDPQDIQKMVDAGMLKYADFVGYHPYRQNVKELKARIAEVKEIVGYKPLVASEWSAVGLQGNYAAWADMNADFYPVIADNFYAAYYFCSVYHNSNVGPGAILTSGLNKNGVFFNSYNGFKNYGGGQNYVSPADSGDDEGEEAPSTPTTPSPTPTPTTTVAPAVTSVTLFNADTDQAITTITSGQTFDFAKYGTRNLTFVANGSTGTRSVKFNFNGGTRIESVKPWAMFGDSGYSDLHGNAFTTGSHNFTLQAFSSAGATGTAGSVQSFNINFTNSGTVGNTPTSTTTAPTIRGFSIIDQKTGLAISGYNNITSSTTVSLAALRGRTINIIALANSATSSVKFDFTGFASRDENDAAYSTFYNGWIANASTRTLSATGYTGNNLTGKVGSKFSVTLKFA